MKGEKRRKDGDQKGKGDKGKIGVKRGRKEEEGDNGIEGRKWKESYGEFIYEERE